MSLASDLEAYIARARRSPLEAGDPRLLDQLAAAAKRAFDGSFAALTSPIAPVTWAVSATLGTGSTETAQIPIDFSRPVEIVGVLPVVTDTAADGGTGAPSLALADLDVRWKRADGTAYTRPTVGAGQALDDYVPLPALSILTPRTFGLRIDGDPKMTLQFRRRESFKTFNSAKITLALFGREIG